MHFASALNGKNLRYRKNLSRQEKLRMNNQRYSSSLNARILNRFRQKKFRSKNKKLKNVTDQSTNPSKRAVKCTKKIIKQCCLCLKKVNYLKKASEMSDAVNFYFSFRLNLKAFEECG